MMIGSPLWLWLLAAIAVPVAIHLWNRRKGESELLGTFRFLPEKSFAKAGRIELHEIPLLIVRIFLVLIVVLLLADLFLETEKRQVDTVKLVETEEETSETWIGDTVLEMRVKAETVDSLGWWNLAEQADHDRRPGGIIVNGDFSLNRFKGDRPVLHAEDEWTETDRTRNKMYRSRSWTGPDNEMRTFVQRVENGNVISGIETGTGSGQYTENSFSGKIDLLINESLAPEKRKGIEIVANQWGADISTVSADERTLAVAGFGGRQVVLKRPGSDHDKPDVLMPGSITGVGMEITLKDTTAESHRVLLRATQTGVPVLWQSAGDELMINAEPPRDMASWFYAGLTHQLLKEAAGVENDLSPGISASQRSVIRSERIDEPGNRHRNSASGWLFLILLIGWATERFLAARRGM